LSLAPAADIVRAGVVPGGSHMTHRLRLALLLSSFLTSMSCGDPEADAVGGYIDNADRYARGVCECEYNSIGLLLTGKGYDSKEECLEDLPANSAERGCVEGLFADATVDYSAVLDCRAEAYARSATCLNSRTCTDTARGDCYKDLGDDIDACPDLPDSIENDLNDCIYN
jgi:hypothetical protein